MSESITGGCAFSDPQMTPVMLSSKLVIQCFATISPYSVFTPVAGCCPRFYILLSQA